MKRVSFVLLLIGLFYVISAGYALAQRPACDGASFAAYVGTGYRVAPNITYMTASGVEPWPEMSKREVATRLTDRIASSLGKTAA